LADIELGMELQKLDLSRQQDLDALVKRIKRNISKLGGCRLRRDELSIVWYNNVNLSDERKRVYLHNFAMLHRLFIVVDYGLECARFG
jgi:hypothetical protein